MIPGELYLKKKNGATSLILKVENGIVHSLALHSRSARSIEYGTFPIDSLAERTRLTLSTEQKHFYIGFFFEVNEESWKKVR